MSRTDSIQDCEDCLPPADAFDLVGDETRLSILEALWRIDTPARFSRVRAATGMRDSARFNYHLDRLRGQFVRKVESGGDAGDDGDGDGSHGSLGSRSGDWGGGTDALGGYELRTAGQRVVQAVLAGSFTHRPRRELAIDDPCTRCGTTLRARYGDERLAIDCPDCGRGHGEYPFPPGGLEDRTDAEVLAAFDDRVRHLNCLAKDGVCPACNGRTETTVERRGDDDCCLDGAVRATFRCRQCGHERCAAPGLALLDQSPVVSFYADHGVDLSARPYWRFEWCVSDHPVTVLDTDPWRARVTLTAGDERLDVVVDDDLAVREVDRR